MSILLVILGLVLFIGLVVVHEFGHFVAARRNGVDVEEFGIGFPPKAKTIARKNGTEYTLNWLPLGGFVRLKGENDEDDEPGSFGAASLSTKVKIMLAGVLMNLVTAFLLLTFLAMIGMPKIIPDQFTVGSDTTVARNQILVGLVGENSPAEQAGIEPRDELIGYRSTDSDAQTGYTPIESADKLPDITENLAGQSVEFVVIQDEQEVTKTIELRSEAEVQASIEAAQQQNDPSLQKGYLGVSPTEFTVLRSTWSAPVVAAGLIKQMTVLTFDALGELVSGIARGDTARATEQVAGPVGIFVLIREGSVLGYQFILMIIAIISLTLAIMNALPIPALDGGRLFVTLLFRAIRKPLTKDLEEKIHGTGFVALMALFVLITIVDVRRFF